MCKCRILPHTDGIASQGHVARISLLPDEVKKVIASGKNVKVSTFLFIRELLHMALQCGHSGFKLNFVCGKESGETCEKVKYVKKNLTNLLLEKIGDTDLGKVLVHTFSDHGIKFLYLIEDGELLACGMSFEGVHMSKEHLRKTDKHISVTGIYVHSALTKLRKFNLICPACAGVKKVTEPNMALA